MQVAAEIHEPIGASDHRGQDVRSHHIDGQDRRAAENAGVVDDSVQSPNVIHLCGDPARLFSVGEIADDRRCATILQSADGGEPFPVPDVDDDVVSLVEQRIGGG